MSDKGKHRARRRKSDEMEDDGPKSKKAKLKNTGEKSSLNKKHKRNLSSGKSVSSVSSEQDKATVYKRIFQLLINKEKYNEKNSNKCVQNDLKNNQFSQKESDKDLKKRHCTKHEKNSEYTREYVDKYLNKKCQQINCEQNAKKRSLVSDTEEQIGKNLKQNRIAKKLKQNHIENCEPNASTNGQDSDTEKGDPEVGKDLEQKNSRKPELNESKNNQDSDTQKEFNKDLKEKCSEKSRNLKQKSSKKPELNESKNNQDSDTQKELNKDLKEKCSEKSRNLKQKSSKKPERNEFKNNQDSDTQKELNKDLKEKCSEKSRDLKQKSSRKLKLNASESNQDSDTEKEVNKDLKEKCSEKSSDLKQKSSRKLELNAAKNNQDSDTEKQVNKDLKEKCSEKSSDLKQKSSRKPELNAAKNNQDSDTEKQVNKDLKEKCSEKSSDLKQKSSKKPELNATKNNQDSDTEKQVNKDLKEKCSEKSSNLKQKSSRKTELNAAKNTQDSDTEKQVNKDLKEKCSEKSSDLKQKSSKKPELNATKNNQDSDTEKQVNKDLKEKCSEKSSDLKQKSSRKPKLNAAKNTQDSDTEKQVNKDLKEKCSEKSSDLKQKSSRKPELNAAKNTQDSDTEKQVNKDLKEKCSEKSSDLKQKSSRKLKLNASESNQDSDTEKQVNKDLKEKCSEKSSDLKQKSSRKPELNATKNNQDSDTEKQVNKDLKEKCSEKSSDLKQKSSKKPELNATKNNRDSDTEKQVNKDLKEKCSEKSSDLKQKSSKKPELNATKNNQDSDTEKQVNKDLKEKCSEKSSDLKENCYEECESITSEHSLDFHTEEDICKFLEQLHSEISNTNSNDDINYNDAGTSNKKQEEEESQSFQPGSEDARLWILHCKAGEEEDLLMQIIIKQFASENTEHQPLVLSAFAQKNLGGFVFVEAFTLNNVKRALKDICGFKTAILEVPENEMIECLKVVRRSDPLVPGQWVRIKSGLYKGDLAQVCHMLADTKYVFVNLVPRVNYEPHSKRISKTGKQKNRLPAKLFQPTRIADKSRLSKWAGYYKYEGNLITEKGFLIKVFHISSLEIEGVHPESLELEFFQHAPPPRQMIYNLISGDKITVIKGEMFDLTGEVVSVTSPIVEVLPDFEFINEPIEFLEEELTKLFIVGDYVKVIHGRYNGDTGFVVKITGGAIFMLSDLSKSTLKVSPQDLHICQNPSDSLHWGDFVSLPDNTVGVVVRLMEDEAVLLNKDNCIVKEEVGKLKKIKIDYSTVATDALGNTIIRNSIVSIINGKFTGYKAEVKQIVGNILFVHCHMCVENYGIFICRTQEVILVGGTKMNVTSKASKHTEDPRLKARSHVGGTLVGKIMRITEGPYTNRIGVVKFNLSSIVHIELICPQHTIIIHKSHAVECHETLEGNSSVMDDSGLLHSKISEPSTSVYESNTECTGTDFPSSDDSDRKKNVQDALANFLSTSNNTSENIAPDRNSPVTTNYQVAKCSHTKSNKGDINCIKCCKKHSLQCFCIPDLNKGITDLATNVPTSTGSLSNSNVSKATTTPDIGNSSPINSEEKIPSVTVGTSKDKNCPVPSRTKESVKSNPACPKERCSPILIDISEEPGYKIPSPAERTDNESKICSENKITLVFTDSCQDNKVDVHEDILVHSVERTPERFASNSQETGSAAESNSDLKQEITDVAKNVPALTDSSSDANVSKASTTPDIGNSSPMNSEEKIPSVTAETSKDKNCPVPSRTKESANSNPVCPKERCNPILIDISEETDYLVSSPMEGIDNGSKICSEEEITPVFTDSSQDNCTINLNEVDVHDDISVDSVERTQENFTSNSQETRSMAESISNLNKEITDVATNVPASTGSLSNANVSKASTIPDVDNSPMNSEEKISSVTPETSKDKNNSYPMNSEDKIPSVTAETSKDKNCSKNPMNSEEKIPSVTPETSKDKNCSKSPMNSEEKIPSVTPETSNNENCNSSPMNSQEKIPSVTPETSKDKNYNGSPMNSEEKIPSVTPETSKDKNCSKSPMNSEEKIPSVTPETSNNENCNSSPMNSEKKILSVTPETSKDKNYNGSPMNSEEKIPSVTPETSKDKNCSKNPMNSEEKIPSVTPETSKDKHCPVPSRTKESANNNPVCPKERSNPILIDISEETDYLVSSPMEGIDNGSKIHLLTDSSQDNCTKKLKKADVHDDISVRSVERTPESFTSSSQKTKIMAESNSTGISDTSTANNQKRISNESNTSSQNINSGHVSRTSDVVPVFHLIFGMSQDTIKSFRMGNISPLFNTTVPHELNSGNNKVTDKSVHTTGTQYFNTPDVNQNQVKVDQNLHTSTVNKVPAVVNQNQVDVDQHLNIPAVTQNSTAFNENPAEDSQQLNKSLVGHKYAIFHDNPIQRPRSLNVYSDIQDTRMVNQNPAAKIPQHLNVIPSSHDDKVIYTNSGEVLNAPSITMINQNTAEENSQYLIMPIVNRRSTEINENLVENSGHFNISSGNQGCIVISPNRDKTSQHFNIPCVPRGTTAINPNIACGSSQHLDMPTIVQRSAVTENPVRTLQHFNMPSIVQGSTTINQKLVETSPYFNVPPANPGMIVDIQNITGDSCQHLNRPIINQGSTMNNQNSVETSQHFNIPSVNNGTRIIEFPSETSQHFNVCSVSRESQNTVNTPQYLRMIPFNQDTTVTNQNVVETSKHLNLHAVNEGSMLINQNHNEISQHFNLLPVNQRPVIINENLDTQISPTVRCDTLRNLPQNHTEISQHFNLLPVNQRPVIINENLDTQISPTVRCDTLRNLPQNHTEISQHFNLLPVNQRPVIINENLDTQISPTVRCDTLRNLPQNHTEISQHLNRSFVNNDTRVTTEFTKASSQDICFEQNSSVNQGIVLIPEFISNSKDKDTTSVRSSSLGPYIRCIPQNQLFNRKYISRVLKNQPSRMLKVCNPKSGHGGRGNRSNTEELTGISLRNPDESNMFHQGPQKTSLSIPQQFAVAYNDHNKRYELLPSSANSVNRSTESTLGERRQLCSSLPLGHHMGQIVSPDASSNSPACQQRHQIQSTFINVKGMNGVSTYINKPPLDTARSKLCRSIIQQQRQQDIPLSVVNSLDGNEVSNQLHSSSVASTCKMNKFINTPTAIFTSRGQTKTPSSNLPLSISNSEREFTRSGMESTITCHVQPQPENSSEQHARNNISYVPQLCNSSEMSMNSNSSTMNMNSAEHCEICSNQQRGPPPPYPIMGPSTGRSEFSDHPL